MTEQPQWLIDLQNDKAFMGELDKTINAYRRGDTGSTLEEIEDYRRRRQAMLKAVYDWHIHHCEGKAAPWEACASGVCQAAQHYRLDWMLFPRDAKGVDRAGAEAAAVQRLYAPLRARLVAMETALALTPENRDRLSQMIVTAETFTGIKHGKFPFMATHPGYEQVMQMAGIILTHLRRAAGLEEAPNAP